MNAQRSAFVQAVLEGIPLPATRAQLVAYALGEDASIVPDLQRLPDAEFDRLDEVGEQLTMRPSAPRRVAPAPPRPESGKPPGGRDYLTPFPQDTGKVRHDAPPDNPPTKAIEKASKTQKDQQAELEGTA